MIKTILVGLTDDAETATTTQRAIELATLHGARITAITLLDVDRLSRVGAFPAGMAEYARKLATARIKAAQGRIEKHGARLEAACAEVGVSCTISRVQGSPVKLLANHSRAHDLVLVSMRRLAAEEVGAKDARSSEATTACYDLAVSGSGPILEEGVSYRPVRRVLVAYDGSQAASRALHRFVTLNPWPDAEVRVVNFGTKPAVGQALIDEAISVLRDHGFDSAHGQFVQARPHPGLKDLAKEWDADVIVIGNKARSAFKRAVRGDTAHRMIREGQRALFMAS